MAIAPKAVSAPLVFSLLLEGRGAQGWQASLRARARLAETAWRNYVCVIFLFANQVF